MNISNDTLPRCAENGEPVEPIPVIPFKGRRAKPEPVAGMRSRLNLSMPSASRRWRPDPVLVGAVLGTVFGVTVALALS